MYASDVKATNGELKAITLPARLEPTATYAAGVVSASKQQDVAKAFVDDLVSGNATRRCWTRASASRDRRGWFAAVGAHRGWSALGCGGAWSCS